MIKFHWNANVQAIRLGFQAKRQQKAECRFSIYRKTTNRTLARLLLALDICRESHRFKRVGENQSLGRGTVVDFFTSVQYLICMLLHFAQISRCRPLKINCFSALKWKPLPLDFSRSRALFASIVPLRAVQTCKDYGVAYHGSEGHVATAEFAESTAIRAPAHQSRLDCVLCGNDLEGSRRCHWQRVSCGRRSQVRVQHSALMTWQFQAAPLSAGC